MSSLALEEEAEGSADDAEYEVRRLAQGEDLVIDGETAIDDMLVAQRIAEQESFLHAQTFVEDGDGADNGVPTPARPAPSSADMEKLLRLLEQTNKLTTKLGQLPSQFDGVVGEEAYVADPGPRIVLQPGAPISQELPCEVRERTDLPVDARARPRAASLVWQGALKLFKAAGQVLQKWAIQSPHFKEDLENLNNELDVDPDAAVRIQDLKEMMFEDSAKALAEHWATIGKAHEVSEGRFEALGSFGVEGVTTSLALTRASLLRVTWRGFEVLGRVFLTSRLPSRGPSASLALCCAQLHGLVHPPSVLALRTEYTCLQGLEKVARDEKLVLGGGVGCSVREASPECYLSTLSIVSTLDS
ncbi:unnamed protein product [Prorocentrum cordatum]|uniref:Uncharacterized protein n=1 Tax=Prorocentrum cordatum TaxID=2364126 RepID=A0ABN9SGE8_9DINO|nr:unnamed protein product [Polarella glacialis]